MRITSRLLLAMLLALAALPAAAQQGGSGDAITVGVKAAPPFAVVEDGEWAGLSIELWERVAKRLDLESELVVFASVDSLLAAVEAGRVEVAVGALSVTAEREESVDFTHPFYTTGLAIAVPTGTRSKWLAVAEQFLSIEFLRLVLVWSSILLFVGWLVWLFERRANPEQFGGDRGLLRGIGEGFWFSAVTMTTVGYGDKAPQTLGGRVVALVWMFSALVAISSLTAAIASSLTLGGLGGGAVESVSDLDEARVGTVVGSASAQWLERRRIRGEAYASLDGALSALQARELEAVVYDEPLLRYLVHSGSVEDVRILDRTFEDQYYGFALPEDSPLREPINRILLDAVVGTEWDDLLFRYLGERMP